MQRADDTRAKASIATMLDQIAWTCGYHWKEYGITPEALMQASEVKPARKALKVE